MHLHDIESLLARHGYILRRQTGTHRHYYDSSNRRITFALPHDNGRELPRALVHELRRKLDRNEIRPNRAAAELAEGPGNSPSNEGSGGHTRRQRRQARVRQQPRRPAQRRRAPGQPFVMARGERNTPLAKPVTLSAEEAERLSGGILRLGGYIEQHGEAGVEELVAQLSPKERAELAGRLVSLAGGHAWADNAASGKPPDVVILRVACAIPQRSRRDYCAGCRAPLPGWRLLDYVGAETRRGYELTPDAELAEADERLRELYIEQRTGALPARPRRTLRYCGACLWRVAVLPCAEDWAPEYQHMAAKAALGVYSGPASLVFAVHERGVVAAFVPTTDTARIPWELRAVWDKWQASIPPADQHWDADLVYLPSSAWHPDGDVPASLLVKRTQRDGTGRELPDLADELMREIRRPA